MKKLLLTICLMPFLISCSIVTKTCRYTQGPASITVQADMTGGSVVANIDADGSHFSYPPNADGNCPSPVSAPRPTP